MDRADRAGTRLIGDGGLDGTRAADILWTINHPDLWQLLVGERGWTPEQYEQWSGDTACSQLLGPHGR